MTDPKPSADAALHNQLRNSTEQILERQMPQLADGDPGGPSDPHLEELRRELKEIDRQLLAVIERRFDLIRRVGEHKRGHEIPMMNWRRVQLVTEQYREAFAAAGLPVALGEQIADALIRESCLLEARIIAGEDRGTRAAG